MGCFGLIIDMVCLIRLVVKLSTPGFFIMPERYVLLFFLILLMLNGCALHAPKSELVMFKDPVIYPHATHRGGWGFSVMGGSSYESGLRREEFEGFETPPTYKIGFTNRHKLGGGFYFLSSDEESDGSVSTTLGLGAAGLDVTGGVFGRWYFTVSGSFLGRGPADTSECRA